MDIAALILWILTAGGGSVLLATWISKGGARRGGAGSRFPAPLIFGHFLLAAAGLVLWIAYVAATTAAIGWAAFVLLAVVALLGFSMFARWIPTFQASRRDAGLLSGTVAGQGSHTPVATRATNAAGDTAKPAERHFPVLIVFGHGLLAATTLVLVLLTMLGVGG